MRCTVTGIFVSAHNWNGPSFMLYVVVSVQLCWHVFHSCIAMLAPTIQHYKSVNDMTLEQLFTAHHPCRPNQIESQMSKFKMIHGSFYHSQWFSATVLYQPDTFHTVADAWFIQMMYIHSIRIWFHAVWMETQTNKKKKQSKLLAQCDSMNGAALRRMVSINV